LSIIFQVATGNRDTQSRICGREIISNTSNSIVYYKKCMERNSGRYNSKYISSNQELEGRDEGEDPGKDGKKM
jgi:hypothetical protein